VIDWTTCPAVERHPSRVSGAWVFRGTRVPVSALFSNLEGGATVDELLEWFPGVLREQVNIVLEHAPGRSDPRLMRLHAYTPRPQWPRSAEVPVYRASRRDGV
jgi:uncharacterized protein (DUF433 family)